MHMQIDRRRTEWWLIVESDVRSGRMIELRARDWRDIGERSSGQRIKQDFPLLALATHEYPWHAFMRKRNGLEETVARLSSLPRSERKFGQTNVGRPSVLTLICDISLSDSLHISMPVVLEVRQLASRLVMVPTWKCISGPTSLGSVGEDPICGGDWEGGSSRHKYFLLDPGSYYIQNDKNGTKPVSDNLGPGLWNVRVGHLSLSCNVVT
ncbi:hypothetical protein CPC08DRAFT_789317 [Agrocybe pediades]|nr:hypothetical protein CPC08DRAFT_789317 [Agrocybe pediades]